MGVSLILWVFVGLRLIHYGVETALGALNYRYCTGPSQMALVQKTLGIGDEDAAKTLDYFRDKYWFNLVSSLISTPVVLSFLVFGGLGFVERATARSGHYLVDGLLFFGLLSLLSGLLSLPFDYYQTFVTEQRHGFNRQTVRGFVADRIKLTFLSGILGGLVLAAILALIVASGEAWWLWAWAALSTFSLVTAWLYPVLLAPLFNKFSPMEPGELKDLIMALARRVGFNADGISVMDASRRSSHGNAYFTGVFGKKRIVLFDTLVNTLGVKEIEAVLAHELGHFKLHHVRWSLIRSVALTGSMFYALHLTYRLADFYLAFGLSGVSAHGALIVFSLWFGPIGFALQPLINAISRANEFAADTFAQSHTTEPKSLGLALLKLRESSHAMPLSHPVYSAVYHSHPPLVERLRAMHHAPGE